MKYLTTLGQFFTKSKKRIAVLFVVILLVIAYLWSTSDSTPKPTPTGATPTPTGALTLQEQSVLRENKQRLISQLPYNSEQFTVQYFPDQDYFFVQIQQQPYATNKSLAEQWFKQNGVNPDNVNINWGAVRGAGPQLQ